MHDAVQCSVERWRATAEARQIVLEPAGDRAGTAWCARADLDRALDVLIENALHYSPAGSEVTVAGEDGRIEVRDRGPGLAPGEDELVFERFHRGRDVFQVEDFATVIGTGPDDLILAAAKNCPVEAISVVDSETGLQVYP
jgi:signal transduction histidine kinase